MATFNAGAIEATLDLDVDPFQRGLAQARAEGRKFGQEKFTAHLDVVLDRKARSDLAIMRRELTKVAGDYTARLDVKGFAEAQAKVTAFKASLSGIGGETVKVGVVGGGFGQTSNSINVLTGRIALLLEAVAAIGPALVPIGALAVPALSGLASQIGFAALGAGSLVVAFQGVGEAMKATNDAAIEPTAENLAKARDAMAAIGPEARGFVAEFQAMRPVFADIRDAAAAGWFPGLTEALGSFRELAPSIESLFGAVGGAGGDLIADAFGSLASDRWAPFLAFLEREAPDAIESLGAIVGDLTHGMATLWMSFNPLNEDFTAWLERVAAGFDAWAQGLAGTAGFQQFVEYVRDVGPQVADTFAAIGDMLLEIAEAAAPLGGPVLQALEAIAEAVAAVADSDLGTPVMAMVTAFGAFRLASRLAASGLGQFVLGNRQLTATTPAAAGAIRTFGADLGNVARYGTLATDSSKRLQGQLKRFAGVAAPLAGLSIAATGAADGIGLTNTATFALLGTMGGIPGIIGGAAVGAVMDLAAANNSLTAAIDAANAAAGSGDLTTMRQALTNLGEEQAEDGFLGLSRAVSNFSGETLRAEATSEALAQAIRDIEDAATSIGGKDALSVLLDPGRGPADNWLATANALNQVDSALASLSGWLDRREALRGFDDAMQSLTKSINAGAINEWGRNIDAVGRSILQVAETMEGRAKFKFVDSAIAGLEKLARNAGPKARNQINALIGQLDKLDGTKANPKAGLEDKEFRNKSMQTQRRLTLLNLYRANPNIDLDSSAFLKAYGVTRADLAWLDRQIANPQANLGGNAPGELQRIDTYLDRLSGRVVTTYVNTVSRSTRGGPQAATGGYIRGPGSTTSDDIPAWLSDKEYVVRAKAVEHYGVDLMHQINDMRLAAGGEVHRGPAPARATLPTAYTRTTPSGITGADIDRLVAAVRESRSAYVAVSSKDDIRAAIAALEAELRRG